MIKFLARNYDILILTFLCIFLIALNFDFSRLVIGLDNASPYFNLHDIISRIKGTSAVVYGGLVFQFPLLFILRSVEFSPEVISNLYLSINLLLGSLGILFLSRLVTGNKIAALFSSIVLVTSLFTFWIFGHPNFLFIASYGSIPFLIYFLSKESLKLKDLLPISIFSVLFLTTSVNIVAFLVYSLLVILISTVIIGKGVYLKRFLIWFALISIIWIAVIQAVMLYNGDFTFFVARVFEYISALTNNPYMIDITSGIITSERMNGILDTARFATGWMELHNTSNTPVFEFYSTYKNSLLYMILGLIPFLLSILVIFWDKSKRIILLTTLLIVFIILTSKYGVSLLEDIPYVREALRWPTSKSWPIYIVPITVLSGIFVSKVLSMKKYISIPIVLILFSALLIHSYPVLNGNLISVTTSVNIPAEYFEIPRDTKVLILPHPQKLYMREYDWGYYGSDFLSYINNSEIVDSANLYEYAIQYKDIFNTGEIPSDIQYVLYNRSAEKNLDSTLLEESRMLLERFNLIDSNKYFDIYER